MMKDNSDNDIDIGTLVKKIFSAYETKNRKQAENLLTNDFTFTSPLDDHIDKKTYFEKCWTFSNENPKYKFEKIFVKSNEVFVLYECETKTHKRFRNTEFFKFDGSKIKTVEVYFGVTLEEMSK